MHMGCMGFPVADVFGRGVEPLLMVGSVGERGGVGILCPGFWVPG